MFPAVHKETRSVVEAALESYARINRYAIRVFPSQPLTKHTLTHFRYRYHMYCNHESISHKSAT